MMLYVVLSLTEQCHDIFATRFLHNSDPSGPLIHKLKYFFAYGVDFAEIFARKKISVVLLTQIQFHEFFNTIFHNYNSKGNNIQNIFI